jgi:hypothetical protein
MTIQQLIQKLCIRSVILGSAGTKGLSITSQLQRVDRVEFEKLVTHQMINERAPTLL